jgi:hypothetical protein
MSEVLYTVGSSNSTSFSYLVGLCERHRQPDPARAACRLAQETFNKQYEGNVPIEDLDAGIFPQPPPLSLHRPKPLDCGCWAVEF